MIFKYTGAMLLAASVLTLSACGGAEQPVADEEPAGVPGLSVSDARVVLPPVAGNPAAVYFNLSYEGDRGLTIRKADVAGAESAMMHDYNEHEGKMQMMEALPIGIKKNSKVEFKPGAAHVMAFGFSPDLKAGDTTDVTLTVSGGGTYTFPAEIRSAGDER